MKSFFFFSFLFFFFLLSLMLLYPSLWNDSQSLELLQHSGKLEAVVAVVNGTDPAHAIASRPASFASPDSTCPNCEFGLYANTPNQYQWNPTVSIPHRSSPLLLASRGPEGKKKKKKSLSNTAWLSPFFSSFFVLFYWMLWARVLDSSISSLTSPSML